MKVCPCKGCVPPERTEGCHGRCSKYIDWKKEHDAQRERCLKEKGMYVFLRKKYR